MSEFGCSEGSSEVLTSAFLKQLLINLKCSMCNNGCFSLRKDTSRLNRTVWRCTKTRTCSFRFSIREGSLVYTETRALHVSFVSPSTNKRYNFSTLVSLCFHTDKWHRCLRATNIRDFVRIKCTQCNNGSFSLRKDTLLVHGGCLEVY